jgi:tetratricopeptide (TPR) repeat protein
MRRIVVDPPQSEARRERVEKKLFEQLAAVRVVERAEAVIPPERPRRTGLLLAGGALAAAAVIALVLVRGGDPNPTDLPAPSRVVTPVGGTSQVTLPGALIEAQSDTSVEVQHGPGGAITLVIARGAVECDVEPRGNRPPFKVVAGDVTVEVVGTRFTVARTPSPRVDVARGKVRVIAPGGQWLVEAGEAWPDPTRTASVSVPLPVHEPEPEPAPVDTVSDPVPAPTPAHKKTAPVATVQPAKPVAAERERARESYKIANRLEDTDLKKAAQLYRAIATDGKGMEAVALVSLAEVQLKRKEPTAALAALDELSRRFPNAANAEDAAWFRYEALRAMGKRDEARGAAADYLRQFPNGAYAERLRR